MLSFPTKGKCALPLALATCLLSTLTAFAKDKPEEFEPPVLAACNLQQLQLLSTADDCLILSGSVDGTWFIDSASNAQAFNGIKLKAESVSSFAHGQISAAIELEQSSRFIWGYPAPMLGTVESLSVSEAYVTAGNSTFLTVGLVTKSVANLTDDEPLNFLGTFYSTSMNKGVGFSDISLAGLSAQITHEITPQLTARFALENIAGLTRNDKGQLPSTLTQAPETRGTLVGSLSYETEDTTAHITTLAGGVLDGQIETYAAHFGATHSFDNHTIRAAMALGSNNSTGTATNTWNALLSGKSTFNQITISATGEFAYTQHSPTYYSYFAGLGASLSYQFNDIFKLDLGTVWGNHSWGSPTNETIQISAKATADLSETLELSQELGSFWSSQIFLPLVHYAITKITWTPETDFELAATYEANSAGGYMGILSTKKEFN